MAVFVEAVKRYDKRVGLRILYREYEVPEKSRPAFRKMWDKIAQEIEYASGKQEPETNDGDSGTPARETVRPESGSSENEQKPTPRLRGDKRKGPQKPKKEKTEKEKPKQSTSKT